MGFASSLRPGELIIDDNTIGTELVDMSDGFSTGYRGMFQSQQSADALTFPFPRELLIPESDWQGWIQEQEEQKTRVSDLVEQAGLPCKDQGQTNYCWCNAPVHLAEIWRVIQGQAMIILSAASVGAPVTGFKNRGGWGDEALAKIINDGIVPAANWPSNYWKDKKYQTPENLKLARNFQATEWYRLVPRNKQEHISCLLRRIPVAVGLNYWGHEVTDYEAVWVNGQIGVRMRNQWTMDWPTKGAGGYAIRQGSKMLADDAVAIRAMKAF